MEPTVPARTPSFACFGELTVRVPLARMNRASAAARCDPRRGSCSAGVALTVGVGGRGLRPGPRFSECYASRKAVAHAVHCALRSDRPAYTLGRGDDRVRGRSGRRGRRRGPHVGTVVMKFGGTSVADPREAEGRRAPARRGAREAATASSACSRRWAHDRRAARPRAGQISPRPQPRELDMLISVGERISCALAAMAIDDLGHEAISLTGSQAGIVTDTAHGKAKIVEVRAAPDPRGARRGPDRARRRLPGRLDRLRGDDARPRRLRHDRRRARRRARRGRLRDLHRRRGRLHAPTRASCRRRASSHAVTLRRDARDGRVGRQGAAATLGRVRAQPRRPAARPLDVHRRRRHVDPRGGRADAREGDDLGRAPNGRGDGVPGRRRRGRDDCSARSPTAGVNVDTIVQTGPEIVFSARVDDRAEVGARARRARRRSGRRATTSARSA